VTAQKPNPLHKNHLETGYGSFSNYDAIQAHGAVPYIAFKSIHTGRGGGLWKRMYHYWQFNRDEFLQHYHKRSNVESTFSMIKAKFGDAVRSKTDIAMIQRSAVQADLPQHLLLDSRDAQTRNIC
jgi:transposase